MCAHARFCTRQEDKRYIYKYVATYIYMHIHTRYTLIFEHIHITSLTWYTYILSFIFEYMCVHILKLCQWRRGRARFFFQLSSSANTTSLSHALFHHSFALCSSCDSNNGLFNCFPSRMAAFNSDISGNNASKKYYIS